MKHAIVVLAILGAVLAVPGQAGAITFRNAFGSLGSGQGQYISPNGIALDASGDLWVADLGNYRVQHVTDTGTFISQLGTGVFGSSSGTFTSQFKSPTDVAVDASNNVWVADGGNNRIRKFNGTTGAVMQTISGPTGNLLSGPQGLDVDNSGNIWVADSLKNRILKFSSTGTLLLTIGGVQGTGNTQLWYPSDVVVDATGNVWIADRYNNRIVEYNSTGGFIQRIGGGVTGNAVGTGNGEFDFPTTVTLDSLGNLWVADSNNDRLQVFSSTGGYLDQFGSFGTDIGQFNTPYGIAVDALGNVWVTDQYNNRIETTIPEPVTMAGLALGLSCLTGYIRRRRTA